MTGHDFTGANCHNAGSAQWFPVFIGRQLAEIQLQAMDLCEFCPHTVPCAERALSITGVSGIWAGIYVPSSQKNGRRGAIDNLHRIAKRVAPRKPRGVTMRVTPPKPRVPKQCIECPNMTLPKGTPRTEMGGYTRYGAAGRCSNCYQRFLRAQKREQKRAMS